MRAVLFTVAVPLPVRLAARVQRRRWQRLADRMVAITPADVRDMEA